MYIEHASIVLCDVHCCTLIFANIYTKHVVALAGFIFIRSKCVTLGLLGEREKAQNLNNNPEQYMVKL